ncbi:MAG TPA: glycerol-3-phosphate dehydrogenase/oxidase [Candidatus Limnocylindrales bacterium]|nr:glycerol-3-phosphate dehydrogenase/oxidase [Candidatus Limnocylindrales bacterium]
MIEPVPLERRSAALRALADERWDVLVVGGGIVGAGALLDAVSRGLRAALIERDDLAVGTSSRSSRLIHGGLRYLETFRFHLVREALAERSRLLELAPHLVRLEPFLFPVYGLPFVHHAFYGSGLLLYDLLGAARDGGFSEHLSAGATLERAPMLRRRGLRAGIVYHDGVEDDARMVVTVARTAISAGALAATRVAATGLLTDREGRAIGVRARDAIGDAELEIRAERIVDARGVWAGRSDGPWPAGEATIVPSRGSHLVFPRERIPIASGMTLRIPGRVLFIVPWPGAWVVGTTDDPDAGPPDRPAPTGVETRAILELVNRTLELDLRPSDAVGAYAGLRPLVAAPGQGPSSRRPGSTVSLSREHRVWRDPSGLVRVAGGKFTTYRLIARDAVEAALGGEEARRRPSRTHEIPLLGAAPQGSLDALAERLARECGLPADVATRLVERHGTEAQGIVGHGTEERLGPDVGQLEAEVRWAVREELALSLDDVLARRTRLATLLPDRGAAIAPRVAAIVGAELGWDAARQAREVEAYLADAHREYDVPAQAGDPAAAAAAAGAGAAR